MISTFTNHAVTTPSDRVTQPLAPLPGWLALLTAAVVFVLYSNAAVVAVKFHGVPKPLAMLSAAPLLIPVGYYLLLRREGVVLTGTLPWLWAFLVIQTIGAVFSRQPELALGNLKPTILEGLFLYLAVVNALRDRSSLLWSVIALLLAGALMGGLTGFQQITGAFENDFGGFAQVAEGEGFYVDENPGAARQRRLCGPIGEQNRYAQVLLMLLPLGMYLYWSRKSGREKLLIAAACGLIAWGAVLTFSRGAAVAFALLLGLMCLLGAIRPSRLLMIVALAGLMLAAIPQYRTRLASIPQAIGLLGAVAADEEDGPDGAMRGRATAMLGAVRVWMDYPWLGVGPGMYDLYSRKYTQIGGLRALEEGREAHCLYLELAAEHGALGLTCFLIMAGLSLRRLNIARRRAAASDPLMAHLATGFLLALIAYLASGMFLHFSYVRYFWLMLALADAAGVIANRIPGRE